LVLWQLYIIVLRFDRILDRIYKGKFFVYYISLVTKSHSRADWAVFVCLNASISKTIRAKDLKLGTQIKFVFFFESNLYIYCCHRNDRSKMHLSMKSILVFWDISTNLIQYTSGLVLYILTIFGSNRTTILYRDAQSKIKFKYENVFCCSIYLNQTDRICI